MDPWINTISNDNSGGCFWFHFKKFDTWHIFLEDLKKFFFNLKSTSWFHFRVIKLWLIFKEKNTCHFSYFRWNRKIWLSGGLIMSHWISGRVSTIIWMTSRYCSKILNCFVKKKNLNKIPLCMFLWVNGILVKI